MKCPIAALLLCRQCRGPELIGRVLSVGIISNYNNYHYHRRGDGDRVALPTAINTAYLGTSHFKTIDRGMFFSVSSNYRTGGKMLWYGMGWGCKILCRDSKRLNINSHSFGCGLSWFWVKCSSLVFSPRPHRHISWQRLQHSQWLEMILWKIIPI